ncbi:MAG: tRNA pseudouridine(13) synthase TruD [Candidatus Bathyarchaeota archaeon]|nr:tRNA pseudouridine(13) synthase TruD [Candidatus Bathyarchaeota archaeon]
MQAPEIDKILGMEIYASTTEGTGGAIRKSIDDFVVQEVLVDGTKAQIDGTVPSRALCSSQNRQRFLLCSLVKRDWDTLLAVKNLAKALGVETVRVQAAGIKDAKAVTAQHLTLENVSAEEAAKVDIKDIKLTPIGYIREALTAYYLLGNSFTINITELQVPKETIEAQISQTMQQINAAGGIPNFYGHQRFGTARPITHVVGKHLIQDDYEGAAMAFLAQPSKYERETSRQARTNLQETRDFKAALQEFPVPLRYERYMLMHLSENPTDFAGAFRRLPQKLLSLFVQAQQSFLFNRFLSERIKADLPLNEALLGDFVVGVERNGLPMANTAEIATEARLSKVNEAMAAGRMRVALPMFGAKGKLSGGVMGEIEQRVLDEEGVKVRAVNEFSYLGGKGGVRAALTPVKDFKAEVSEEKATLSFTLHRGCYATVLLREIIKPENPIAAGF